MDTLLGWPIVPMTDEESAQYSSIEITFDRFENIACPSVIFVDVCAN